MTNKLVACLLGLCLSGSALAQEEPPTEAPGKLHNLGAFQRVQLTASAILTSLTDMSEVSSQIGSDLFSTNTLLEETQSVLGQTSVTSGLLSQAVGHDLPLDLEDIEFAMQDLLAECADEQFTCSGSVRTIEADGTTASFSCYPYRCGLSGDCNAICASDADCSGGTHCSDANSCVATSASRCEYVSPGPGIDPDSVSLRVLAVTGAEQVSDCTPYVCNAGTCKESCITSADCAVGTNCDTGSRRCVYPAGSPPPPGMF